MTIFTLFTLTACRNEDVSNSQAEMTAETKMPSDIIGSWVSESDWKEFGPQGGPDCGTLIIEEKNIIEGGGQQACNIKQVAKVDNWHKLSVSCEFCDEGECQNIEETRFFSYDNDKNILIEKFDANGGKNLSLNGGNDGNKSFTRCLPNQQTEKIKSVNNSSQKEIDCESSAAAYQSCLAQMRSDGAKNALPKEFYGNWGFNRNKDQCFFDGGGVQISKELFETFAYVNKDSMGWDGECKILDVERETSVGHMKLSLECLDNIVNPEKSGNHSRNLNIIIVNESLEISEDSDNPNLGVQTLYRCPEIADPNN